MTLLRTLRTAIFPIAILIGIPVFAFDLPNGITLVNHANGISQYRLENGLTVLLVPDASKPTTMVNVTYKVGSSDENYGETGMAHLLEHMMFKGTNDHPDIVKEFNKRGMNFNGNTGLDRTTYYENFQADDENLKWALKLEADRMVNSPIRESDWNTERYVVLNEFENGENSPVNVLFKRIQNITYDWHSYGRPTIGNHSDIVNVSVDHLRAFYKTYYQPDNAVLVVAGHFEPNQILNWINKDFASIPKPTRTLPIFWTVEPPQDGPRQVTIDRVGDYHIVALAYHVPSDLSPESSALDYVAGILGDSPNGRLYKALVQTGKATQVFFNSIGSKYPGLLIFGAIVKKGEPLTPVRNVMLNIIENFSKEIPTKNEMERIRFEYENQFNQVLNNPQNLALALSENFALGDWRLVFLKHQNFSKITSHEVATAANNYLFGNNRTTAYFKPDANLQRAVIPAAPTPAELIKNFKSDTEVTQGQYFDPSQDNIDQHTQLSTIGGLKIALLPKKSRGQTVNVAISFRWGDAQNLIGKLAIAGVTDALLTHGTNRYTKGQIADEFSKLQINGDLTNFQTTRTNLSAALKLVANILKNPAFSDQELKLVKEQMIVDLQSQHDNPNAMAKDAMNKHFKRYSAKDIRAYRTIDQQIADLKAVTLEQVKSFHKNFYGASQGEIAIVGDFDTTIIQSVLSKEFSAWESHENYTRVPNENFTVKVTHQLINTPDKANGFYLARENFSLQETDPDYPALVIANTILGDAGLSSRIMDRIRQKEGLSYGGGSNISPGIIDRAGNFVIGIIAAPKNLEKVKNGVLDVLKQTLQNGFTEAEVANAKSSILQQRLQARSSDRNLANAWITNMYLKRTFSWSKQFEDKLRAVTLKEANTALRKFIHPDEISTFIAGDQTKFEQR